MEYERIKTLSQTFYRVRVSEQDLMRIAKKVEELSDAGKLIFTLSVENAEGDEELLSHDPEFFASNDMPLKVKRVSILLGDSKSSMVCRLRFVTGSSGETTLSVRGNDPRVLGLFQKLVREIEPHQIYLSKLVSKADKGWFGVITASLGSWVTIYTALSGFQTWQTIDPGFVNSDAHDYYIGATLVCTFMVFMLGLFGGGTLIKTLFTPVQFNGRVSDPSDRLRRMSIWILGVVLIPVLLGVFSNWIYELITK